MRDIYMIVQISLMRYVVYIPQTLFTEFSKTPVKHFNYNKISKRGPSIFVGKSAVVN